MRGGLIFCFLILLHLSQAEVGLNWTYTNEETPRRCATNCDNFGKGYKWCWVTQESWAECTPGETVLQQNVKKSDSQGPCVSLCGKFEGSRNNWCFTSVEPMRWDSCKQTDIQELYLSVTDDGILCRTNCNSTTHQCATLDGGNHHEFCTPGDLPINLPVSKLGHKCSSLCLPYIFDGVAKEACLTINNVWDFCEDGNSIKFLNSLVDQTTTELTKVTELNSKIASIIIQQATPAPKPRIKRGLGLAALFPYISLIPLAALPRFPLLPAPERTAPRLPFPFIYPPPASTLPTSLVYDLTEYGPASTLPPSLQHTTPAPELAVQSPLPLINFPPNNFDPNILTRYFEAQTMSTQTVNNPNNPIISYDRSITPDFQVLVHSITAHIYPRHLPSTEDSRILFPRRAALIVMIEQNALCDDEMGHLLAFSLGGLSEVMNLAPQSRNFNRMIWRAIEFLIARLVKSLTEMGHYVRWKLTLRRAQGTRRPTHYFLVFSHRNAQGQLIGREYSYEFHDPITHAELLGYSKTGRDKKC